MRQSGCQPEIWPILWRRWVDYNFMAADFLDKQLLVVWYIAQTATSPYFANYFWEIEPCFIFAFFSIIYLSSHTPSISICVRGCMAIANGWKSPGSIYAEFLPCAVHILCAHKALFHSKNQILISGLPYCLMTIWLMSESMSWVKFSPAVKSQSLKLSRFVENSFFQLLPFLEGGSVGGGSRSSGKIILSYKYLL